MPQDKDKLPVLRTDAQIRRAMAKSRPGDLLGYDEMGQQIWNEDEDDAGQEDSCDHSSSDDNQRSNASDSQRAAAKAKPRRSRSKRNHTANADSNNDPKRAKLRSSNTSNHSDKSDKHNQRLNFKIGTPQGDERCIELMLALCEQGEQIFIRKEGTQALQRVADTCNEFALFRTAGEGSLSISTIKKKLYSDWIPHFSKQREPSLTGSGGGGRR